MCVDLRFTGIAILLIGLQLLSPKILNAKVELGLPNIISSTPSFVAVNDNSSPTLNQIAQGSSDFDPPDNGGPDNTRGSGTR